MKHTDSLPLNALADALGNVRAEIRALRAREARLRQALIEAHPNGPVTGARYEVCVREHQRRVFDRDSLPGAILGDDRFWMTRTSRTVVTRSCSGETFTPPPHRSEEQAGRDPGGDLWGRTPDPVLIEDF